MNDQTFKLYLDISKDVDIALIVLTWPNFGPVATVN